MFDDSLCSAELLESHIKIIEAFVAFSIMVQGIIESHRVVYKPPS